MPSPLAILFPGQGSQEPGMGRDAAEASADVMALWKKAERISNRDLRGIYWDGDETAMADTRNLQPALTVVNLGLWLSLPGALKPDFLAGHSLGEFSALAAAQVLSLDAALELVSLRGRLMAEADPEGLGAMAAVLKLDQNTVLELLGDSREATGRTLVLANLNSPAQFVASGEAPAVADLEERVKAAKGRAVRLPVSGAFHSPLMDEAARELAKAMRSVDWNKPKISVFFNATAQAESDPVAIQAIMARQMTSQVRWIEIMQGLWDQDVRDFVELGPKGVLTRLAKANLDPLGQDYQARNIDSLEKMQDSA